VIAGTRSSRAHRAAVPSVADRLPVDRAARRGADGAERAGEWDSELWRDEDEATLLAAGGARPALNVVRPLDQFDKGDPRETALRQPEA
jgi:hypothetical protein